MERDRYRAYLNEKRGLSPICVRRVAVLSPDAQVSHFIHSLTWIGAQVLHQAYHDSVGLIAADSLLYHYVQTAGS